MTRGGNTVSPDSLDILPEVDPTLPIDGNNPRALVVSGFSPPPNTVCASCTKWVPVRREVKMRKNGDFFDPLHFDNGGDNGDGEGHIESSGDYIGVTKDTPGTTKYDCLLFVKYAATECFENEVEIQFTTWWVCFKPFTSEIPNPLHRTVDSLTYKFLEAGPLRSTISIGGTTVIGGSISVCKGFTPALALNPMPNLVESHHTPMDVTITDPEGQSSQHPWYQLQFLTLDIAGLYMLDLTLGPCDLQILAVVKEEPVIEAPEFSCPGDPVRFSLSGAPDGANPFVQLEDGSFGPVVGPYADGSYIYTPPLSAGDHTFQIGLQGETSTSGTRCDADSKTVQVFRMGPDQLPHCDPPPPPSPPQGPHYFERLAGEMVDPNIEWEGTPFAVSPDTIELPQVLTFVANYFDVNPPRDWHTPPTINAQYYTETYITGDIQVRYTRSYERFVVRDGTTNLLGERPSTTFRTGSCGEEFLPDPFTPQWESISHNVDAGASFTFTIFGRSRSYGVSLSTTPLVCNLNLWENAPIVSDDEFLVGASWQAVNTPTQLHIPEGSVEHTRRMIRVFTGHPDSPLSVPIGNFLVLDDCEEPAILGSHEIQLGNAPPRRSCTVIHTYCTMECCPENP